MNIPEVSVGFYIGSFPITNTMIWTWVILGLLSVLFIWLGSGLKVRNIGKKQVVAEWIYSAVGNMVRDTMGPDHAFFIPYILALFSFLMVSNISGFWGLGIVRPPTADLATPLAMAIMTFILTQWNHIRVNGIGTYLRSFLEPFPIMLPMNIVSEIANPVSLTFRMFGNLLGGLIITTMIYGLLVGANTMPVWIAVGSVVLCVVLVGRYFTKLKGLPKNKKAGLILLAALLFLPLAVTSFVHFYFDLFAGILQAYIFCLLSMIFISA